MYRFVAKLVVSLILLMGAVLVSGPSVAFVLPPSTLAQDATPGASPIVLSGLLQKQIEAIEAGDGEAVAALYTEDGSFEDVPSGTVARGRETIAAFFAAQAAQEKDVVMQPTAVHEGDGWAVLEYDFAATDAKSGERVELRGVTVFELEGALISRGSDYYAPPTENQGHS